MTAPTTGTMRNARAPHMQPGAGIAAGIVAGIGSARPVRGAGGHAAR